MKRRLIALLRRADIIVGASRMGEVFTIDFGDVMLTVVGNEARWEYHDA